jgi:hypothetical protein
MPTRGLAYAQHLVKMLRRAPTRAQVELLAEQMPLVFLPAPGAASVALHDFSQSEARMNAAYEATRALLLAGGLELAERSLDSLDVVAGGSHCGQLDRLGLDQAHVVRGDIRVGGRCVVRRFTHS